MAVPTDDFMRAWIADARTKGVEDYHVDEIDPDANLRNLWFLRSLDLLEHVESFTRELGGLNVAAGYSLRSGSKPFGINFNDAAGLQKEFDDSPPSIYIFSSDSEFKLNFVDAVEARFDGLERFDAYFFEFLTPHDGDYARSLFLIPSGLA